MVRAYKSFPAAKNIYDQTKRGFVIFITHRAAVAFALTCATTQCQALVLII